MFSDKFLQKHPEDIDALTATLDALQLSGKASVVGAYEDALAKAFDARYCIAVSTGSASLHTALAALGVGPGDEVIVQATATLPTVMPVLAVGATPVFVDSLPGSLDVDLDDFARCFSKKTAAVLVLHLWGYPLDMESILNISRQKGVPVIEDAAQAHFASFGARYVGTFGDFGCFSTHDRKILSTGEGGFILTNREDLFEAATSFSKLGNLKGEKFGLNYRLPALCASLGLNRLPLAHKAPLARSKIAAVFKKNLEEIGLREISFPSNAVPNYYGLVLCHESAEGAVRIKEAMDELSIPEEIRKYRVDVLYKKKVFSEFQRHCPNSEDLFSRAIAIPTHQGIGPELALDACHALCAEIVV